MYGQVFIQSIIVNFDFSSDSSSEDERISQAAVSSDFVLASSGIHQDKDEQTETKDMLNTDSSDYSQNLCSEGRTECSDSISKRSSNREKCGITKDKPERVSTKSKKKKKKQKLEIRQDGN